MILFYLDLPQQLAPKIGRNKTDPLNVPAPYPELIKCKLSKQDLSIIFNNIWKSLWPN